LLRIRRRTTAGVKSLHPIDPRSEKRRITMSSLKAEALVREFHYNGIRIPDPGPELSVEQVRDLLSPNYPEIATASLSGPEATGTALRYTFSRAIGTKG
jgi:PRTRC genetic system protein C